MTFKAPMEPYAPGVSSAGGMKPVLIRQHVEAAPPGVLGEWLEARGLPYEVDRSWLARPLPDPTGYAFVASLGHAAGAGDTHDPAVAAEHELLDRAVALDVPVLGLCYGGQVLAAVLGADVGPPAPVPELGWREIQTDDPSVVPAGPWLEWHFDRFVTPPGAVEIARTPAASQAFRAGPHLGIQFHPEATVEIVAEWAALTADRLAVHGIDDGNALLTAPAERRAAAKDAAFRLFDAFVAHFAQTNSKKELPI
jgi:GMP synthase-like glutamine amidotransferase